MKNERQINFYSVTNGNLEKSLAKLVEKIYDSKIRLLIRLRDKEDLEKWDNLLWSFSPFTFIAHGTIYSESPEVQPVLITDQELNLNQADALLTINDVEHQDQNFRRLIYIFDNDNMSAEDFAKKKLAYHLQAKEKIKYWRQDQFGTWQELEKY